jgi:hypothetical protein
VKIGPSGVKILDKAAGEGAQQQEAGAIRRVPQGHIKQVFSPGGLAAEQGVYGLGLQGVELGLFRRQKRGEILRGPGSIPKLGAELPPHEAELGVVRRVAQRLFSHGEGLGGAV